MSRQMLRLDVVLQLVGQIEPAGHMEQREIGLEGAGQIDGHFRRLHGMGRTIDRHKDAFEHEASP